MLARSKEDSTSPVANAYDLSGATYGSYADGDTSNLFRFSGTHGYADRQVWACVTAKLSEIRLSGTTSLSVLDAGCGPGTWLKRLVISAKEMGFVEISARGFDVSAEQIQQARVNCRRLSSLPGVRLEFTVGDLTHALPEADDSTDLTLCLYSVLSHIPPAELPSVARELGRVTRGSFITTVRPIGSMASGLVAAIDDVRRLRHDQRRNWCEVELADGGRAAFSFHLFSTAELECLFQGIFKIENLEGLDFFHGRFAADSRWNPPSQDLPHVLAVELANMEKSFSGKPEYNDHANHLLLVGRKVPQGRRSDSQQPRPKLTLRSLRP
ncbi:class I SAM-dependent methyltransferase [Labrys wisconsinensis]|uniref:SAM-dependent methyltransferase n=1 Tax=Labrys wisconsinensis TaxID=425677 RepID=A0ABU0J756_9HYPH|nr:class I SAM-dependent methyltransferase [Labrys wisconsinensis]MDQ0470107.1 SAM-dependent methyltransferase [Labrys wisconsinensis]